MWSRCIVTATVAVSMAAWAGVVEAQAPAGSEFQVNTSVSVPQNFPVVGWQADSGFLVAWQARQANGRMAVPGRRYDAAGNPLGGEFLVSTDTTADYGSPAISADRRGNALIVWAGGPAPGLLGIFGRWYDATGSARGAEFTLRTQLERTPFPRVASDAAGNFVVVWTALNGTHVDVFGRRHDAAGTPRGAEFRVNTYTTDNQGAPDVSSDPHGNFVVVWTSAYQDGGMGGVFGQRFDASGTPLGSEFQVNTYTRFSQGGAAVAMDALGRFVVAWTSDAGQDGSDSGVFAQRYDAAGTPTGAEFRINSYTSTHQYDPSVAVDSAGNFTVSWTSMPGQDGDGAGIFARRFAPDGAPRGAEFRVNTYTSGHQLSSAAAVDASGNTIVAWQVSYSPSGLNATEVRAQRFGGLFPASLSADDGGNGVWEPGETVTLTPRWRNLSGAVQTFDATLSRITGPAGAAYGIVDGAASYGTVPDGGTQPCLDCYAVAVGNPDVRPLRHWDASALEAITPEAQGQTRDWALHIGGSFTDVLPDNPFYRFVETLLHNSVTAGCAADSYCPGASTAREQMAVFVLVAKEGPAYRPPACSPPNTFADVPATSPFCRWIEELARRQVVGGCGGGNYCPTSPVTREQMAVFVLRTLDPNLSPPPCSPPNLFADVPETSPFCPWIEELARRNVVSGCGGGNYCPTSPVTRDQMAVFLTGTFGLTLYGP